MTDKTVLDDYGYGMVEEDMGGGKYLSLRKKNDKVKIRLVSKPVRSFRYWETGPDGKNRIGGSFATKEEWEAEIKAKYPDKDTRPKMNVQYSWVVLDREDDNKVKVFSGAAQIAIAIAGLIADEEWGDPTTYDLRVTRTEERPNYYKTVPLPNGKGPITAEEAQAVKDADIDLHKEVQDAGDSKSHNEESYGGAVELETLPTEEPKEEAEVDVEADDDKDMPF